MQRGPELPHRPRNCHEFATSLSISQNGEERAFSWQLRGLHGNNMVYVAVSGCTRQPSSKHHIHVDP